MFFSPPFSYSTTGAITASPSNDSMNNPSCSERDAQFNLIFTIGSTMFCIGSFAMGQINFKFGTRLTRLAAA